MTAARPIVGPGAEGDAGSTAGTHPGRVPAAPAAPITVPLARYEDEFGNRIEYDGPEIANATIKFRGRNNVARVAATAHVSFLSVDFNSNNGEFTLGSNTNRRAFGASVRVGEDAKVAIGDEVSATTTVTISAVEGVSVDIGRDVMFASRVQVRADDGHPIFDVQTGRRANPARGIHIGAHVWVGIGTMIMPGVSIGDGSVIGAASIVTSEIPNNVIAAGIPARILRRDIAWERPHLGLVPPYYKPDSSTVATTEYWRLTEDAADDHPAAPVSGTFVGRIARRLRAVAHALRAPAD